MSKKKIVGQKLITWVWHKKDCDIPPPGTIVTVVDALQGCVTWPEAGETSGSYSLVTLICEWNAPADAKRFAMTAMFYGGNKIKFLGAYPLVHENGRWRLDPDQGKEALEKIKGVAEEAGLL